MRDVVERAKGGDLDAFGVLVDRYKDMAYGAAYAILGNFHDAQDTAQDAFVQAWRKLSDLKDWGAFPGWLYRITRNLSLDRRRRARGNTQPIDDVADTLPDQLHSGPRQCAEQKELHEAVLAAVRSLSEPNRLATALFYIDGYSIEEVADFLEVPAGTVKRRLHHSRIQLRERMVDMVEDTLKSKALPKDFSHDTLKKIGDFACLEIIGTGGMGSVYKCEHPVFKHQVAVKIAAAQVKDGWRTSPKPLDKLSHPGFVKTFSYGEHEGHPYVVMEYLHGESLQAWLSKHATLAPWDALRVVSMVVDAVVHAHSRGVIVGAIGPYGIVMLFNGHPVICDIGPYEPAGYQAPERAGGDPQGTQTDIWSLGVLMYELLMGKPLFEGDSREDILRTIQTLESVDLKQLAGAVPDYILAILKRCLQKKPQDRYPNAAALQYALEEARFTDLVRLSNWDLQRLLKDVDPAALAIALIGAAASITEHMLRNVGDEAAKRIRQAMNDNPPTSDTAHAARLAIVALADCLLDEQRIVF